MLITFDLIVKFKTCSYSIIKIQSHFIKKNLVLKSPTNLIRPKITSNLCDCVDGALLLNLALADCPQWTTAGPYTNSSAIFVRSLIDNVFLCSFCLTISKKCLSLKPVLTLLLKAHLTLQMALWSRDQPKTSTLLKNVHTLLVKYVLSSS